MQEKPVLPPLEISENRLQDSEKNTTEWSTETTEKFNAENTESVGVESTENLDVSSVKVTGFQSEIQDVSVKISEREKVETFSHLEIKEFIETLDISALKTQTRNWYRRRMKTPENMAKWKAAKIRFESLGYNIKINSESSIGFEVKMDKK